MKRIKDTYLETIQTVVSFSGKRLLEIGCGDGSRTIQIAENCLEVIAIDPNLESVALANKLHPKPNIQYQEGSGEELSFDAASFNIVFFTLSLHHVPIEQMNRSISEAVRVVKSDGFIVFFEPAFNGSFFKAELAFDACDGDERKEKAAAYVAMLSHPSLQEVAELIDETIFSFDSLEDFQKTMKPKKGSGDEIQTFLERNEFVLSAERRINIFRVK